MKNQPTAYLTLDQFRQLASRFTAKCDYITHMVFSRIQKDGKYGSMSESDFLSQVYDALNKPADHYISREDMQHPLAPKCEQRDFFEKELF